MKKQQGGFALIAALAAFAIGIAATIAIISTHNDGGDYCPLCGGNVPCFNHLDK